MELHPDLDELAFLIGIWRGAGSGEYPTVEDFEYEEEVSFAPLPGKPVLLYTQRTRQAGTPEPLHSEVGYLRSGGPGRVELALAQPTGLVETHAGTVEGGHIHLRSLAVERTPTAKEVTDVERHIEVAGDLMRYRLSMAAVGEPLQVHLRAALRRVEE